MLITCDLIDLADMLDAARAALKSPPRADDRLRELRQYLCSHCADKDKRGAATRCTFCKISAKNA